MLLALSVKLYDFASVSLHGCRDRPTDVLDSLSYRILGQVCIALGGLWLGMAQHFADDRQREPRACAERSKGMAEVV